MEEFVPESWLFDPVDMKEIESEWIGKPGPCGVTSESWAELRSHTKKGDEIRAFSSPEDYWENMAGRAGYAVVREGRAIAGIVTMMN